MRRWRGVEGTCLTSIAYEDNNNLLSSIVFGPVVHLQGQKEYVQRMKQLQPKCSRGRHCIILQHITYNSKNTGCEMPPLARVCVCSAHTHTHTRLFLSAWAQRILHESDKKQNIVLLSNCCGANKSTNVQQAELNINMDALCVCVCVFEVHHDMGVNTFCAYGKHHHSTYINQGGKSQNEPFPHSTRL